MADSNKSRVKFDRGNLDFQQTLRKRVDEYFTNNNIGKHANGQMVFKTILIISMVIGSYSLLISNTLPLYGLFLVACILGFSCAMVGLNIGHDAIHGSYSTKPKVNKALGLMFNFMGANDYMWAISHNVVHHTYTNIPEFDADIDQVPVLRYQPDQDLWKVHKFQYIYAFLLYTFTSLSWVMMKDYVFFMKKNIGGYIKTSHPTKEWIRLIVYKLIYYTTFIAIPIMVMNVPAYMVILLFVTSHVVFGFTLAIVFQMAHLVDGIDFPKPSEKGEIKNSWLEHQLYTTANFANKKILPNYLFGGLNFQIEHHLFPNICHVHYTKIAPIVKETALEFGLPYLEYKNMASVISSHIKLLKKLGTQKDYTTSLQPAVAA